jgi:hypothetical protein
MYDLFSLHHWIARTGLVDRFLAGDSDLCSIVGILIGCVIGHRQLKRQLNQDASTD